MRRWCLSLMAGLVLSGPLLAGQNLEELLAGTDAAGRTIEGRLDWSDRTLVVYGEGVVSDEVYNRGLRRLLGQRAAKVVAYRNLLELVGQVRVDGETNVSLAMVASDSVRIRVSGLVRGAEVVPGSQQEQDGVYRVALRLRLTEEFARALLPPTRVPEATQTRFVPPKPFTGLVIDARGLDLQPGLSPRILGPEGREIYSGAFVDPAYAATIGVVGYQRDWEQAEKSDRLGSEERRPLTIKAAGVAGRYRTDAVVSEEDRVRIAMADAAGGFLRQCRVVFVLGPQSESTVPASR
ncbi:MAG: hypothetical protein WDA75_05675 [Candidatus Latescibacterota bacterium]|jgi:hypothetical protein